MKLVLKKALYPSLLGLSFMMSATAQVADDNAENDDDIYILSPFEVTQSDDVGYLATSTLAGTRLRTSLKDVGSAVSVVTKEFLEDTGSTDNKSLLVYTTNTEVGGTLGNYVGANMGGYADESANFTNPNNNTRVRGLTSADNTRNYFLSNIPWDGYNVSRVDLQRGPNAILFGLGSPSGIINTSTDEAEFYNAGDLKIRVDENGSFRSSINYNMEVLKGELGVRIAVLNDREKYRQEPAYEDDQRLYLTFKYKPEFLQSDTMTTTITGTYEKGNIDRNAPRSITPVDYISAWFNSSENGGYGLNKEAIDPVKANDKTTKLPGYGQASEKYDDDSPNPYYLPALGDFGQSYGGPMVFLGDSTSSDPTGYRVLRPQGTWGLDANGNRDGSIEGVPYSTMLSVKGYADFATKVGLPYSNLGQYKSYHLSDPTIFNFYKNIIDGPNKTAWQDFEVLNATLKQTFFSNRLGYEFAIDHQDYEQGQVSYLSDTRQGIYIDINKTYNDGTENPNFGRAFISSNTHYGTGSSHIQRDAVRATAFAEYDFKDLGDSWWTKVLGRHVITGLYSRDRRDTENRSWLRAWLGDDYLSFADDYSLSDTTTGLNVTTYLGDSMAGDEYTSPSGINLPRVQEAQSLGGTHSFTYFDSHWDPSITVDPGDEWVDDDGNVSTQSENPDNYIGWTTGNFTIVEANDENRDSLTTAARMSKEIIDSQAAVWQGYLFDGGIVGMYGRREDRSKAYSVTAKKVNELSVIDDTYAYSEDADRVLKTNTSSWSIVAHVNHLLGKHDFLPFNVSLYYNESDNFQPAANRIDILGEPLDPPKGHTIDRSIAISTKDNRYSLKITKYETSIANATSSIGAIQSWFIGGLEGWGGNFANMFEYDLSQDLKPNGPSWAADYKAIGDQTTAEALAKEQIDIAAWRAHQQRMRTEFPAFYDLWLGGDPGYPQSAEEVTKLNHKMTPDGFTLTEDTVSSGYEIELIANPTDSWRISMNVSKSEATRSNVGRVGGDDFIRWIQVIKEDIVDGTAGDLRTWWGGGNPIRDTYMHYIGGAWALLEQNGTNVDEMREWHVNIVNNYSFNEGFLKGLNIGMGYRWMSENIIGYPLIADEDGKTIYDLDNPVEGPAQDYWDFWIGYRRSLTDRVDWKVQLNIKNAFSGDELLPMSVQPDGSVAAWSIAPHRVISLTNTFSF